MRHARPVLCESLSATARIATGGQARRAILGGVAPGRTYHQLSLQASSRRGALASERR